MSYPPFLPLSSFDLNKHHLQSPSFNPPVCYLPVHSVWFQSPLREALVTYPPLHTFSFPSPHFPPTLPSLISSKGSCVIYQKCKWVEVLFGQKGGVRKDEQEKDEGVDRVRQGCIMILETGCVISLYSLELQVACGVTRTVLLIGTGLS